METKKCSQHRPHIIGISNSISNAMAPPRISANEVEIDTNTAVPKMGRDTHLGVYFVAASERQSPVTIPSEQHYAGGQST